MKLFRVTLAVLCVAAALAVAAQYLKSCSYTEESDLLYGAVRVDTLQQAQPVTTVIPQIQETVAVEEPHGVVFPRLANYYLTGAINPDQATQLAKWDVVVLGLENEITSPEALRALHEANPDIIRLCYVATNEFATKHQSDPPWNVLWEKMEESDWLYTPSGEHASFWPGAWSFNLTQESTARKIVEFAATIPDHHLWEGVFYDNVWHEVTWYLGGNVDADCDGQSDSMSVFNRRWLANEALILRETKSQDSRCVVVMNGAGGKLGFGVINGRMYEGFPNTLPSIDLLLEEYLTVCRNSVEPEVVILHAEGNETDTQQRMFGFCFCLLGDGYFAYDHGPREDKNVEGDTGWHDCLWWYSEYNIELGAARSAAFFNEAAGVWVREFDEGYVFCNIRSAAASFDIGLGSATRSIDLPARSGQIIFKKDLTPA